MVLKLVALSIDGRSVDVTSTMPFVMKEKVVVEPSRQDSMLIRERQPDGLNSAGLADFENIPASRSTVF